MKKLVVLAGGILFAFLTTFNLNAQVAINTDGSAPDGSAMLDVSSTSKGVLVPRMTSAQRTSINPSGTGLLVYDTDYDSFFYWDGGQWVKLGSQWTAAGSSIYYPNQVTVGGTTGDPSAIMDIQSDTYGLLIPRITELAKYMVPTPAAGLLIYQTDGTPGFYYYDGAAWKSLAGLLSISVTTPLTSTGGSSPTLSMSSPLVVANGGTGATSFNANSIVIGNGTSAVRTENLFVKTATGLGINTSTPNSTLQVTGSIATVYATKSTGATLGVLDQVVAATGTSVTLPTAVGITGRIYTIKNTTTGAVTVNTTSSQTIDGATSYSLTAQYKYVTVISTGTNWLIIGNN